MRAFARITIGVAAFALVSTAAALNVPFLESEIPYAR